MTPKLYGFQRDAIRAILKLDCKAGLFMEMGTGKTRVVIDATKQLPKRVLVVAPLSGVEVWKDEVEKWQPSARVLDCTRGSVKDRAELLRSLCKIETRRRIFVIVGYESFWRGRLRRAILKYAPGVVVYDEAHRLAYRGTRQASFAHSLAFSGNKIHTPPYRLALTGTPMPNGAHDLFSIYKAINRGVFGGYWEQFEKEYVKKGGYFDHQIVGYKNMPDLERKVEASSFRITKAEALDLPEQVDVEIPVELGAKAKDVYEKLRLHAIADVEGRQGKGTALSRVVITNVLRLQQVTSGFVKVTDGRIIDFDESKQRILADLLTDVVPASGRVVVFCRFTHDIDVAAAVGHRVASDDVYVIDGRVPREERDRRIKKFRKADRGVLVAQIKVASLAINLSCAYMAVFYSPDFSLTNFLQSRQRLHRHGQEHKVTYYHLVARDTIDKKIYRVLERKEDFMRSVLDRRRLKALFR